MTQELIKTLSSTFFFHPKANKVHLLVCDVREKKIGKQLDEEKVNEKIEDSIILSLKTPS